jgi:hypothetical protein
MGIMGSLRVSPRSRCSFVSLGSFGSLLVATKVLLLTIAGEHRHEYRTDTGQLRPGTLLPAPCVLDVKTPVGGSPSGEEAVQSESLLIDIPHMVSLSAAFLDGKTAPPVSVRHTS